MNLKNESFVQSISSLIMIYPAVTYKCLVSCTCYVLVTYVSIYLV